MSSTNISNIPVELVLSISSHLTTFKDVVSLAASSRSLHTIWQKNKTQIADTLLARTIPSYNDAITLAEAQLFARSHPCPQTATRTPRPSNQANQNRKQPAQARPRPRSDLDYHPALTLRQARLLFNAKIVRIACGHFLSNAVGKDISAGFLTGQNTAAAPPAAAAAGGGPNVPPPAAIKPHRSPPYLTKTEEERFHHAYYRVWTYMTYEYVSGDGEDGREGKKRQRAIVDDIDLVEHWRMCEVAYFLMGHCISKCRSSRFISTVSQSLHVDEYSGSMFQADLGNLSAAEYKRMICRGCYGEDQSSHWNQGLGDIFDSYRFKLMAVGHSGIIPRPSGVPRDLYIAVFDCHQETMEKMAQDIRAGKDVR